MKVRMKLAFESCFEDSSIYLLFLKAISHVFKKLGIVDNKSKLKDSQKADHAELNLFMSRNSSFSSLYGNEKRSNEEDIDNVNNCHQKLGAYKGVTAFRGDNHYQMMISEIKVRIEMHEF